LLRSNIQSIRKSIPLFSPVLEIAEAPDLSRKFLQGTARFSGSVFALAFEEVRNEFFAPQHRSVLEIADLVLPTVSS
jgi:hypothetical protein